MKGLVQCVTAALIGIGIAGAAHKAAAQVTVNIGVGAPVAVVPVEPAPVEVVPVRGSMAPQVSTGMWIGTSIHDLGTEGLIRIEVKDQIGEDTGAGKSIFEGTKGAKSTGTITGITTASTNTTTIRAKTTETGTVTGMTATED